MQHLPSDYPILLEELKKRIQQAQLRATLAVNHEMVMLYWSIGQDILTRQHKEGWGTQVIERLAKDLQHAFPAAKGYSSRNLKYMRLFAEAWANEQIVQAPLAQIPWYHQIALLEKLKTKEQRLFYAYKVIEHGWSRNVLVHHIESRLIEREGKAITNFESTLPKPQSDLAQQLIKDPYHIDFVGLTAEASERDLEAALVTRIRDFLLELGAGFAFVGSQYPLRVVDEDYYLDLLFYHIKMRCYVIIELKTTHFKPEYSGKMNFYLNVVDDLVKQPDENPTIGLILCRSRNSVHVEYSLRGIQKPIGVVTHNLPAEVAKLLPSVEQIEQELNLIGVPEEDK